MRLLAAKKATIPPGIVPAIAVPKPATPKKEPIEAPMNAHSQDDLNLRYFHCPVDS